MPVIALIFVIAASVGACADVAQRSPTKDEVQAAFKWFDTLGYPDVGALQFVEVSGGNTDAYSDCYELPPNHHRFAFLLNDEGPTFRVLYTNLQIDTLNKSRGTVSQMLPASYGAYILDKPY
jgi:hypothetical protein